MKAKKRKDVGMLARNEIGKETEKKGGKEKKNIYLMGEKKTKEKG